MHRLLLLLALAQAGRAIISDYITGMSIMSAKELFEDAYNDARRRIDVPGGNEVDDTYAAMMYTLHSVTVALSTAPDWQVTYDEEFDDLVDKAMQEAVEQMDKTRQILLHQLDSYTDNTAELRSLLNRDEVIDYCHSTYPTECGMYVYDIIHQQENSEELSNQYGMLMGLGEASMTFGMMDHRFHARKDIASAVSFFHHDKKSSDFHDLIWLFINALLGRWAV